MPPKNELLENADMATIGIIVQGDSFIPIGKLSDETATLTTALSDISPEVRKLTNGLKSFSFELEIATKGLKRLLILIKPKQGSRYYFKQKGMVATPKRNRTRKKQRPTRLQRRRNRQKNKI